MSAIRAVFALALLAMAAGWLLLFRPTFLGGPVTYVMVSGRSMEPTLHSGDLVVVRKESSYGAGDIVAFRVPEGEPGEGAVVIHRIVGGSPGEGFVMQGDNKDGPDAWRPTVGDIVGKSWFSVPGASRSLAVLRSPLLLGLLAGGLAMTLLLEDRQTKGGPSKMPPAEGPRHRRRGRPAPGIMLWLLLILTARLVARLVISGRQ